jgi:hypothetical protein
LKFSKNRITVFSTLLTIVSVVALYRLNYLNNQFFNVVTQYGQSPLDIGNSTYVWTGITSIFDAVNFSGEMMLEGLVFGIIIGALVTSIIVFFLQNKKGELYKPKKKNKQNLSIFLLRINDD